MRPRLKDVASLAGVSTATVSRVVNDRPGVSDAVRDRVVDALRQLEWEPSGMRGNPRRRTVGLLVPELTNPIFPAFAQGIESRLGRSGMTTILCTSSPDGVGERVHVDAVVDIGVAAAVFIAGSHADTGADHGMYADLRERGVAVIVVNGRAPGLEDLPAVTSDDVEAGRLATEHLLRLGHRRIGLAAGQLRYVAASKRQEGWSRALSAAGVDAEQPMVEETYTIAGGRRAGERLLDAGATGIVAASDIIALGVVQAVRARGLRVPEDVSVVGYDDSLLIPHTEPPLTTVRQPVDQLCRAIARLCVQAAEGVELPSTELAFHPELIARGSTGPAPA